MTNAPVKFAIIGVTQPHAAGYAETLLHMPEAEIIAGYDWVDLDQVREKLPEQLREMSLYDDVTTLLDRERPEAVVICMPPSQTPDLIRQAAERGIHIIAEKPCARSAAEFLPAAAAIAQAGVTFSTGFLRHFYPVAIEMRPIIYEALKPVAASPKSPSHTTAPATPQGKYAASKSGTKYHLATCPGAKSISAANKVWFDTKEAAEAAGYAPASNCPGI